MLVYLHVPFCARRCSYCDFAIAVRRETPSGEFADAILAEWGTRQDLTGWADAPALDTLYLGGGTPSRLAPEALAGIIDRLATDRPLAPGAEVTLEANPDDVTPEAARAWRASGINRVSLGVQSFHGPTLAWMHRTHTAEQAERAVAILQDAGLTNLSLDLIYGVPEDLGRDWHADLDRALALRPPHLSCYALTVEEGTPLGKWTARRQAIPADDERVAGEYLHLHAQLRAHGYEHYEVSNAALPGQRAIHNAGYWAGRPFVGLGPSAVSGSRAWRAWNIREWEAWRRAVEARQPSYAGEEHLTPEQQAIEAQYLGLRTDGGLPVEHVPVGLRAQWTAEGWATKQGGRIVLTAEGWLRLDALVARLPSEG